MLLHAQTSLLLLVDLQDKLLQTLPPARRNAMLGVIQRLAQGSRILAVPQLATAQYPQGLGAVREEFRQGAATVLEKTAFSCHRDPAIRQWLEQHAGRRQVVLVGVEAHICILQTALDLQSHGWSPVVVEDACAARDPAHGANAMMRLRQAGICIANGESVLYEWLGDAAHPAFKTLAPLLR